MAKIEQLKPVATWAAELGLTRKCLLRAIAWGHLKAVRLGIGPKAPYFITQEQIDEWLEARTVRRRAW